MSYVPTSDAKFLDELRSSAAFADRSRRDALTNRFGSGSSSGPSPKLLILGALGIGALAFLALRKRKAK